jgi:hypothetical protein
MGYTYTSCLVQCNTSIAFFLVEGAYTQQGRARIRRLRPDEAARPALMRVAANHHVCLFMLLSTDVMAAVSTSWA